MSEQAIPEPTFSNLPKTDLTNCDREPIHIPGLIQPHGVLLVIALENLSVLQVSANSHEILGIAPEELLTQSIELVLGITQTEQLCAVLASPDLRAANPLRLIAGKDSQTFDGVIHQTGDMVILEMEPCVVSEPVGFIGFYHLVQNATRRLQSAQTSNELCRIAADEVRRMTGFDRVMVYQYDADWNGEVVAEERRSDIEPYLGLHYPASDIPKQARELYTKNGIRLVADVDYRPCPILPTDNPRTHKPLDLSFSLLRSVSPIHIQYLKNMGVGASMSISILRDGQLWGLIACHHETSCFLSYEVRMACEFIGQVLSGQLEAKEATTERAYELELRHLSTALQEQLNASDRLDVSLARNAADLMALVGAQGAAICLGSEMRLVGQTPTREQIALLFDWVQKNASDDMLVSEKLPLIYAPAQTYQATASGLLAIIVSRVQNIGILWFRPEVLQTVSWAGDPNKAVATSDPNMPIHPRTSFALWKETVNLRSLPWKPAEVAMAKDFRNAILDITLRQTVDELARVNENLDQFAYVVSHDLRAPLRGITGLTHWIEEDLGDGLTPEITSHLTLLRTRVQRMDGMIEGILAYARIGRVALLSELVDVNALLSEIIDLLSPPSGTTITVDPGMPTLLTDRTSLQQVLMNLIGNAIKHNDHSEKRVTVSVQSHDPFYEFRVSDNGPGIAPKYHDRIWGIFEVLEARAKKESTGIGLAIIRKIVEGQGGAVGLESEEGQGATFFFTWPKEPESEV